MNVETAVLLCTTNNSPLRSHEAGTGSFIDLLKLRIDAGEHV